MGLCTPLSFDELRALGDNSPSASLYPKSLKTEEVNPQNVNGAVDASQTPPSEWRPSLPQLPEGLAAEASRLRLLGAAPPGGGHLGPPLPQLPGSGHIQ